ncbi:MAG: phage holin family protein, partial [Prevotellaceae bacterium]|nr:phage holin family protein [Prevotellaceae bacterium]
MNILVKFISAFTGAVIAVFIQTIPFALICTFAVFIDCISAFRLSIRVKSKYPEKCTGKFTSDSAKKMFGTLCMIYTVICLLYAVDKHIFTFMDMYLANIAAGAFCMVQVVSILENESSCNAHKWAKALQKILIDKTKRHL